MRRLNSLPLMLSLLTIGALACTGSTSSKGQEITCTTGTGGVILSCQPGTGDGSGSGSGTGICHDIDEDGDGDAHDEGTEVSAHDGGGGSDDGSGSGEHGGGTEGDRDGDGIPDSDDCDEHPGEDDGSAGLPYDVRPQLGATTTPIADAFAAEGGQPAAITAVTMDGGTWRLAELQAGTSFVVTQADCDHVGNRDIGRDRVFVTWNDTTASASQTDHLDIRYCK